MSNGLLGKALTVANQPVTVATISANALFATITVHVLNMGTEDAIVRVALTTNPVASTVDYVDQAVVPANGGSLDISCSLTSAGENVIVTSDHDNNVIRVTGLEQLPVQVPV